MSAEKVHRWCEGCGILDVGPEDQEYHWKKRGDRKVICGRLVGFPPGRVRLSWK